MKVRITFIGKETTAAIGLAKACLSFFPKGTQTKYSDRHKPYLHIYIADRSSSGRAKPGRKPKGGGK